MMIDEMAKYLESLPAESAVALAGFQMHMALAQAKWALENPNAPVTLDMLATCLEQLAQGLRECRTNMN